MTTPVNRGSRNWRKLRAEYLNACRQAHEPCWLCGQPIDYTAPSGTPDSFDVDHYHPVSTHPELYEDPANFRPSHSACNRSRGDTAPDDLLTIGAQSRDW